MFNKSNITHLVYAKKQGPAILFCVYFIAIIFEELAQRDQQ